MYKIDATGKSALIIADLYFPFHHLHAFPFLEKCKKRLKPDLVLNLEDMAEYHALSFHDSNHDIGLSSSSELILATECVQRLYELFPESHLVESNHGSMILRRARKHGIPARAIKPLEEIYGTPGWTWHDDLIVETRQGPIYMSHQGLAGYGAQAKHVGMSAIQGHHHSKQEITYHQLPGRRIFNAFTGCLVDAHSLAMAYAKNSPKKPALGCIFLDRQGFPHIVPLESMI